jgi:putative redox protein
MTQPVEARLDWTGELRFQASVGENGLVVDGKRQGACSPMELLLVGLAGCMAIDVVHILGKMRAVPDALQVSVEGVRADSEPRRYTRISLRFALQGEGLSQAEVERAIALSREKYCSVYHSLRSDIEVETSCTIG